MISKFFNKDTNFSNLTYQRSSDYKACNNVAESENKMANNIYPESLNIESEIS